MASVERLFTRRSEAIFEEPSLCRWIGMPAAAKKGRGKGAPSGEDGADIGNRKTGGKGGGGGRGNAGPRPPSTELSPVNSSVCNEAGGRGGTKTSDVSKHWYILWILARLSTERH